jgi:hypothetical protein
MGISESSVLTGAVQSSADSTNVPGCHYSKRDSWLGGKSACNGSPSTLRVPLHDHVSECHKT